MNSSIEDYAKFHIGYSGDASSIPIDFDLDGIRKLVSKLNDYDRIVMMTLIKAAFIDSASNVISVIDNISAAQPSEGEDQEDIFLQLTTRLNPGRRLNGELMNMIHLVYYQEGTDEDFDIYDRATL